MKQREAAIPALAEIRISEAIDRLIELYTAWHAAEPDKGYDAKAAEWQKKRNDFQAAATAETPPTTDEAK